MKTLIKNVQLKSQIVDILIDQNYIQQIDPHIDCNADKIIDGTRKAAIPSLFNGHGHAAMTYFRGFSDDEPLKTWLEERIWPIEPRLSEDDIYWGTMHAALEMIENGTCSCIDMYWKYPAVQRAFEQMGMRAFVGYTIIDNFDPVKRSEIQADIEQLLAQYGKRKGLTEFILAPHAIYTVSEEMWLWIADFANTHDLKIHTHLAETQTEYLECVAKHGVSPVRYLERLGVLSPRLSVAHCVWVDQQDIEILAHHGVQVIHNPNSNLKLASGYKFLYKEMKEAGIKVSVGTDGCASSNNLDIVGALKSASLIQKAWREDPTAWPVEELFDCVTKNAEAITGLKIGRIKPGYLADIALIDLNRTDMTPNHNFLSNLLYSATGAAIDTLICDGRILMENRVIAGKEDILEQINNRTHDIFYANK